jgi:rhamnulokinase
VTVNRYYLAVDIGASSGRHILGWMENGKMNLREIYRFSNGMEMVDGNLCWNLVGLFEEIKAGMRECKKLGINPESMGIDTWAVDFVLLDKQGHVLGKTAGYRDRRTEGMDLKVYERISREELYRRTGIQKQIFNTVYQLMAVKEKQPDILSQAESFLMIPDCCLHSFP